MSCNTSRQPQPPATVARDYLILLPSITMIDIDPLGHIYVVDEDNRISKFDTTGRLLHHVIYPNLGEIHHIDVGNPFKIMTFYRDQQTIVLLDRTLSEIQRINLASWAYSDVTAAALSPDNAIWIFDGLSKALVKLEENGNKVLASDPFDMTNPPSSRPDYIFDAGPYLFVKEADEPLSVFDDFGHYLSAFADAGEYFTVSGNLLFFEKNSEVHWFDIATQKYVNALPIDEKTIDHRIFSFGNQFFASDKKGVYLIHQTRQ